jgi:peptide subunit release factor 1 (eRF1)
MDEGKKVFQNEHIRDNFDAAKGKTWEKIDELAAEVKSKGRKEAVAKVRLTSGRDCLAHHHLHKIGRCVLCNNPDDVMDSEHLLHCQP